MDRDPAVVRVSLHSTLNIHHSTFTIQHFAFQYRDASAAVPSYRIPARVMQRMTAK
jgi:hypothetical protein